MTWSSISTRQCKPAWIPSRACQLINRSVIEAEVRRLVNLSPITNACLGCEIKTPLCGDGQRSKQGANSATAPSLGDFLNHPVYLEIIWLRADHLVWAAGWMAWRQTKAGMMPSIYSIPITPAWKLTGPPNDAPQSGMDARWVDLFKWRANPCWHRG